MQAISPWDDWNLDQTFFTEFEKWQREHPTKRLDQILNNIQSTLERNDVKDLVELLPGGPIPVPLKGLVLALANLVKLGIKISAMKRRTILFTKAILEWISRVSDAFRRGSGSGRFTVQTWENLADARNLVVEICRWAQSRLADKFWARITHGINIERDMEDFKTRLEETKLLFKDLSLIGLAQGQDATLTSMGTLSDRQDEILDQLATLTGRVRETLAREQLETVSQLLGKHAAAKSTYTEQSRGTCDQDTRVSILQQIRDWIEGKDWKRSEEHEEWIKLSASGVLWLSGDAGIGKSAIAATICREYTNKGMLGAQFFASINYPDTKYPLSIFPTLALQLACFSPEFATCIYRLAAQDLAGDMIDTKLKSRLQHLFIDPLVSAFPEPNGPPILIVIDGLDECRFETQPELAEALAKLISTPLPTRIRILLLSRRTRGFNQHLSGASRISLTSSNVALHEDVALYLRTHIQDIVEDNKDEAAGGVEWSQWSQTVERLVGQVANHAAGVYIWAVTAVKFIKREVNIPGIGAGRLPDLLQFLCQTPLGDIHALYSHVLSRIYYHGRGDVDQYYLHHEQIRTQDLHEGGLKIFRDLMGFIVAMQREQEQINRFTSWRRGWRERFNDYFFLTKLDTLLKIRHPDNPLNLGAFLDNLSTLLNWKRGIQYPEMHRSVIDFLLSPSPFSINLDHARQELSYLCLSLFQMTGELAALSLSISLHVQSRYPPFAEDLTSERQDSEEEVIGALRLGFSVSSTAEYRWHHLDDNTHPALKIRFTSKNKLKVFQHRDHWRLGTLGLDDCDSSPYLLPDYIDHFNRLHHFAFLHCPIHYEKPKALTNVIVELLATNVTNAEYDDVVLDVHEEAEVWSDAGYMLRISNTALTELGSHFYIYVFFHRDGGDMAWCRHSGTVDAGPQMLLGSSRTPIRFEAGWKGTMKVLQSDRKLEEYRLNQAFPSEQLRFKDYYDLDMADRRKGYRVFDRLSYVIYRLRAVPNHRALE